MIMRRKRLPDGSFGKLEKVMKGETAEEKMKRLEEENLAALNAVADLYEIVQSMKGSGENE